MGLVPIFKEAYNLVQLHRQRRRIRILGFGAPDTTALADEIHNGESSLVSRYHEFHALYGNAFARGDGIAIDRLKDLIIQLQHGLILALQNAQQAGKISNPSSLVTITITGRTDAFTTLTEPAQRLTTAMPISRLQNLYEIPKNPSSELVPRLTTSMPFMKSPNLQVDLEFPHTTVPSLIDSSNPPKSRLSSQELKKRREKSSSLGRLGCNLCQRKFGGERAIKQHLESPGHRHKLRESLR